MAVHKCFFPFKLAYLYHIYNAVHSFHHHDHPGLQEQGLTPEDIEIVVATHGHVDHIGNLNMFPNSQMIVGFDIYKHGTYIDNNLIKVTNVTE